MPLSPEDGPPPHSSGGLTGQRLDDRYQVERLLGRGGMSEVYLAHHLRMARPCALKVIHPARAGDPDATARFEREARAASRIAHPNICRVYDFGRTPDGLHYLAMEFLEGRTLSAALHAGPLPVGRATRIGLQCAAGLQAAHDAGIVHRDLKPDNVMLVERDGEEQAVLFDFGIAQATTEAGVTRDGLMVGTPEVMSPEQIAGDAVDARSDQYQLALLLYRMLTGALPFAGTTTQETMRDRLTGMSPAPLATLRPGLETPAGLQAVLTRALARRPDLRYPTMRDFGSAMRHALQGAAESPTEVLVRGGNGELSPIPPAVVRQRLRWAARGGWAAVCAAVAVAGYLWLGLPGEDATLPPPPAPAGTVPPAAPSPGPGSSGNLPPPAPVAPAVPPGLPAADSVYSASAPVRERARRMAESVYGFAAAPDTLRAEAAYLVAATYLTEGLTATAREWLVRCLGLQERAGCRRLLNEIP